MVLREDSSEFPGSKGESRNPGTHLSFAQLLCAWKKQATTVSLHRSRPLYPSRPCFLFHLIPIHHVMPGIAAPQRKAPGPWHQDLCRSCPWSACVWVGDWRVSGRRRAPGFKSRVIKSNEAVPPSSASQGSRAPFQIGCPSSAAQITGHRVLQANCSDKAVTVVRVQGCRPLGQRLPITPTEKAAHRACDFYLGRNYPRLFRYLGSSSD